jgi:hypothetical protein
MSYHQPPHELRLAISSEAEALIPDFGGEAHAGACRRAARESVAAKTARRSGRRLSLL